jgi:rhodanese-related sulfurtransferase
MRNRILLLTPAFLFLFISTAKSQNTYAEVTLPELMKKKQGGDSRMVIIDVRTPGEYGDSARGKSGNIGRIKGAINIPLQLLSQDSTAIKQFEAYRDKDIYLICSHSYRSRTVSNMLLKKGYTSVTNVRGGMTEWYRRYDDLKNYRGELYDQDINYKNLSSAELFSMLDAANPPLLIAVSNSPRFFWDSANIRFYKIFPALKNAQYYNYVDSLQILELVKKENRPVVLYNIVNSGAAELADWFYQKQVNNVYHLVGGLNLLYEVGLNSGKKKTSSFFSSNSGINFITPQQYCQAISSKNTNGLQVIDLRADSLYNKINNGVKHKYSHLAGSANFFFKRSVAEFVQMFPDKNREYLFINSFGADGIELADELSKAGYKIKWLIGGYDRWEWYMNNVEGFVCDELK